MGLHGTRPHDLSPRTLKKDWLQRSWLVSILTLSVERSGKILWRHNLVTSLGDG